MPLKTILRPLASVGQFIFDAELTSGTGERREFSQRRIPSGAEIIDHSVLNPGGRRWTISGRVSNLPQPQNFGRPSPSGPIPNLEALVQNLAAGLVGQSTRLSDMESVLSEELARGERVTVVSAKRGKFNAFVESWDVADGPGDGGGSTYSVTLFEYEPASGLSFVDASEEGAALNGSGQTTSLGATSTTDAEVDFEP